MCTPNVSNNCKQWTKQAQAGTHWHTLVKCIVGLTPSVSKLLFSQFDFWCNPSIPAGCSNVHKFTKAWHNWYEHEKKEKRRHTLKYCKHRFINLFSQQWIVFENFNFFAYCEDFQIYHIEQTWTIKKNVGKMFVNL